MKKRVAIKKEKHEKPTEKKTALILTHKNLEDLPITSGVKLNGEFKKLDEIIPVGDFVRAKDINRFLQAEYSHPAKTANQLSWRYLYKNKNYEKVPEYHGVFKRIS